MEKGPQMNQSYHLVQQNQENSKEPTHMLPTAFR